MHDNKQLPFSLHTRPTSRGDYMWYVQYRDNSEDTDTRFLPAKSTKIRGKATGRYVVGPGGTRKPVITGRRQAEAFAWEYLNQGQVVTKEGITFRQYASGFFDPNGSYAKDLRNYGKKVSDRQLQAQDGYTRIYLIPFFDDTRLTKVTAKKIRLLQSRLLEGKYPTIEEREPVALHGGTVNHITVALKKILEKAEQDGLIQATPTIHRVAQEYKQRGVLTLQEIRKLFALEWNDRRYKVANLLAAMTGMRRGEIMALRRCDIRKDHLRVTGSWDEPSQKRKATKTGVTRDIAIDSDTLREVIAMTRESPWNGPESYVFYGERRDRPMKVLGPQDALVTALKRIGIDNETRKARGITFHSWRHFYNSTMINSGIPIQKVQSQTGHSTDAMSSHYYHATEFEDVIAVQQGLALVKGGAA